MPPGPAAALPARLTVVPGRLVLATAADLIPALAPLLPGAVPVTDLDGLRGALDDAGGTNIRLVAIGFSRIVPAALLTKCRAGAVNFHPATPDYPGSAANHLALYEGAERFGVTVHEMVPTIDAGPILAVEYFPIPAGIGHRTLDELTWPALLGLLDRLGPALRGLAAWPVAPALFWRGPANRRADVLTLAHITPDLTAMEADRRHRAFRDGPDSALTLWIDGEPRPYQPGGRIRGWIDGIVGDAIQGWAWAPDAAPTRVRVEIDGRPFRDIVATGYRGDVAAAGHGDGHCGFQLPLIDVPPGARRVDFLLPADEWRRLPGGPVTPA